MRPQFETVCAEYASLWKTMVVRPQRLREVQSTARRIQSERRRYETVAAATNVPWYVVGLIHAMEAGLSFVDHLHNGDPLTERTVHVPRGRPVKGDPPFTWEESAIDALGYDGLAAVTHWCVERIAYELEGYNGWGYRTKRIATPYLWSATNHYTSGKYVKDGVYDPNAVSEQSGAMAILSVLQEIEPSVALNYFDGSAADHERGDMAGEVGTVSKPKSTVVADLVTVGSSIGTTAVITTHNAATPPPATTAPLVSSAPVAGPTPPAGTTPATPPANPAPAAPPAVATPVTPPAQPATSSAATPPPSHQAAVPAPVKRALPSPAKTTTAVGQPVHPVVDFVEHHYAVLLGGLILLLLVGLYLSWKARTALTRSSQQFTRAVPELISRVASGGDIASAPLITNLKARALTASWIAATIVVNVIALAKFLQYFHLASSDWYPPFSWLGGLYDNYGQQAFRVVSDAVNAQFGINPLQWPWLLPLVVLYISTASAFMVANSGLMRRDTSAETLWGAIVHAGWLLAVPTFIMDALRYHVVTRFARQNTVLFFAYLAAFVGVYVGARFVNDDFLAAYTRQHPTAASAILQTVEKGVRADM